MNRNRKNVTKAQPSQNKRDKEDIPKITITRGRLWLFRFIAIIIIPAILIVAVEIGLRIAGYGFTARAILKCKVNGQDAYCDNVKFGWLFFPPNISREFNPFIISRKKPANSCRIFIFGSSAARGEPDPAYSFSRILEYMLSEQYAQVNFEVINTAMTAINSHVVVRIAEDCAKYKPDLFVVYMGNNEVIGPYGAGTVFAPLSDSLPLIHLGMDFRASKIGQLLTNLAAAVNPKDISKTWGGMGMFLEKQVSADDPRLQIVYKNFAKNLEVIVKTAQKRKTPVILATVASNLKDCPPFSSGHRSDITETDKNKFESLYNQGREIEKQGKYSEALEKYLEAERIDSRYAELQYCIGRCRYLLGQYEQAKDRFVNSRELDTVRLRADKRINEIIKETSLNNGPGVYLADVVMQFEQQSPHKITGSELFYEHVHPNFRGNYLLAKSIFEQLEKILPERIKTQRIAEQQIIDEQKCRQGLVYSEWDEYRIARTLFKDYITRSPFTNQLYHDEQVKSLAQVVESINKKINAQTIAQINWDYRSTIEKRPADWMLHWKYGNFAMDVLQDKTAAMDEFNKVLELVPQFYLPHIVIGNLYGQGGSFEQALVHLNIANKIRPYYADIYYGMGVIYQLKKNYLMTTIETAGTFDKSELLNQEKKTIKDAESCYKQAIRLDAGHYPSYINLSFVLADNGRLNEAIKVCRNGLKLSPDSAELHYNLGCFLKTSGQRDEAIKEFRSVLKLNPANALAQKLLDETLKEK